MAKKDVEPFNLKGELLEKVIRYNKLNELKKKAEDGMKPMKEKIIKQLEKMETKKAKSQIYSVSWSHIKETKVSVKKLVEILISRGDEELVKSCSYENEYDKLTVRKRKGGENIF